MSEMVQRADQENPWVHARVAVLYGGDSEEREVSLKTGAAIHGALVELGYRAELLDATRDGLRRLAQDPPDVAFLALHGGLGEDGSVQGFLECLGVPYTGSGVRACAVTMDKAMAKRVWLQAGLPTPRWEQVERARLREALEGTRPLGWEAPCVVKPVLSGSSVGVTMVREPAALRPALEAVLACEGPALLEELIEGRELTVPMLDGASLGVIEVVPQRGFYDYTAKYASGSGTSYLLPAPLEPAVEAEVVRVAQEANRLVGARGVTRVDVMLDGQGRPWILELNSMPGMTATSLVPKAAAARGVPFARFVERMLGMARLERVVLRD